MLNRQQQRSPRDILEDHGDLLVRRVVDREDEVSDALFEVATNGQRKWDHRDWVRLVASLHDCDQTVREWLATREAQ